MTDFGLAKRLSSDLTRTQAVMGTPAYMAPEQAKGEAKFVGPAADVWALGAILYECLTARRAFDADETWAVLRKVTDEAPPPPRTLVAGLPRDLELICFKCLEKNPADRYPTAAALAADLDSFLAGRPVSVRPAGPLERAAKWVRRNPVVAGATAAVFLALAVGAAVSLAFGLEARTQAAEAARANADLSRSNDELKASQAAQEKAATALRLAHFDLGEIAGDMASQKDAAEQSSYLSDIALAHQLWKANDLVAARAALARCPPDRRKWEWHHLDAIARGAAAEHPTDTLPTAVAYSPDGKLLAWATLSGTVVVHDRAAGVERFRFAPPEPLPGVALLAFRPSGGQMAYAVNARVYALDLATGRATEVVPQGKGQGERLSFQYVAIGYAADGRILAALETRGETPEELTITVRDPAAGKGVAVVRGPAVPKGVHARISGAAFSADGARLAAAFADSGTRRGAKAGEEPVKFEPFRPVVVAWEVASGKAVGRADAGGGMLDAVAFDADGRAVAYSRNGQAAELSIGAAPRLFGGHAGEVAAVAFDRAGLLWSGGEDKRVVAVDRATGAERFVLRGCRNAVLRLAVSPDGKEVAAAAGGLFGGSGAIHRFDVSAVAADVWRSPAPPDRVSLVVALAADGRFAASEFPLDGEGRGAKFVIRDAGGKQTAADAAGMWFRGAFRPDGSVAALEQDRALRLVSPDGKAGAPIPLPKEAPNSSSAVVAADPGGRLAVTTSVRDAARKGQWATRARALIWERVGAAPRPLAEADLTAVAPADAENAVLFPTAAAFDRDGKRLAASYALGWSAREATRLDTRGVVLVWETATGKELFRRVTAEGLNAVGFDPQGRVAAAGGTDGGGALFVWEVPSARPEGLAGGAEALTVRGHTQQMLAFAFGPDGRLATAGGDRVVKVWDVASGREVLAFDGFAREVTHVTFTPDGRSLIAATGVDLLGVMMRRGGLSSNWPPAEVRVFRGPR